MSIIVISTPNSSSKSESESEIKFLSGKLRLYIERATLLFLSALFYTSTARIAGEKAFPIKIPPIIPIPKNNRVKMK